MFTCLSDAETRESRVIFTAACAFLSEINYRVLRFSALFTTARQLFTA